MTADGFNRGAGLRTRPCAAMAFPPMRNMTCSLNQCIPFDNWCICGPQRFRSPIGTAAPIQAVGCSEQNITASAAFCSYRHNPSLLQSKSFRALTRNAG
jgi:hypothetical protein